VQTCALPIWNRSCGEVDHIRFECTTSAISYSHLVVAGLRCSVILRCCANNWSAVSHPLVSCRAAAVEYISVECNRRSCCSCSNNRHTSACALISLQCYVIEEIVEFLEVVGITRLDCRVSCDGKRAWRNKRIWV